ncbi:MAG: hypothetical protein E6J00_04845 [Chloroflexi bacterium]|nr:MAG: hypothetical protein E6J00_04845 [Chloroflexota bacterium]
MDVNLSEDGRAKPSPAAASIVISPENVWPLVPAAGSGELPTTRDLFLQAILHLPRLGEVDGTISLMSAMAEIERLRVNRARELQPLRAIGAPPSVIPTLEELEVGPVGSDQAEPIISHFHYLRSFRTDSVSIAAMWKRGIVALCSVSPLDVPRLADRLPISSAREAAVISRIFVFDWAPRNLVSYLLARAEKSEAIGSDVRLLLTYVNPNMGFTGASYRAANWRRIGFETGTRYAYLRGGYVTDRRLASLPASEQRAVEYSRMPLRPLAVFGRFLDEELSRAASQRGEFVIGRVPPATAGTVPA